MGKAVNVALIGAGLWGEKHLSIYKRDPRVNVVAVCDLDASRAASLSERYHVPQWYGDFRAMLEEHPEIDGVAVVTPDHLHRAPVVACLEARKHVLVEKPLAASLADAEAIVEAAEASGSKLMIEFNDRWALPFAYARQAVQEGEIGTPIHGFARYSNTMRIPTEMLKWSCYSSVLIFVGCLVIDAARWILDDEVQRVYATSRKTLLASKGIDTPDVFQSILEFRKGTTMLLENSWVLPNGAPTASDVRFELVGTGGAVQLDLKRHGAIKKYTTETMELPEIFSHASVLDEDFGSVERCIRSFIDCLALGSEPIATGHDGLAVSRVIDGIYRSIETGKPVDL